MRDIDFDDRKILEVDFDYEGWDYADNVDVHGSAGCAHAPTVPDGAVTLTTAATANTEQFIESVHNVLAFQDNVPFVAKARLKFAEAATNQASVAFGFATGGATGIIQSGGVLPKANFNGALIYKIRGETVWRACSSIGTTQSIDQSVAASDGGGYQTLEIGVKKLNTSVHEVSFRIDTAGYSNCQQLMDSRRQYISQTVTLPVGTTLLKPFAYVMSGGAAEVVTLDRLWTKKFRSA